MIYSDCWNTGAAAVGQAFEVWRGPQGPEWVRAHWSLPYDDGRDDGMGTGRRTIERIAIAQEAGKKVILCVEPATDIREDGRFLQISEFKHDGATAYGAPGARRIVDRAHALGVDAIQVGNEVFDWPQQPPPGAYYALVREVLYMTSLPVVCDYHPEIPEEVARACWLLDAHFFSPFEQRGFRLAAAAAAGGVLRSGRRPWRQGSPFEVRAAPWKGSRAWRPPVQASTARTIGAIEGPTVIARQIRERGGTPGCLERYLDAGVWTEAGADAHLQADAIFENAGFAIDSRWWGGFEGCGRGLELPGWPGPWEQDFWLFAEGGPSDFARRLYDLGGGEPPGGSMTLQEAIAQIEARMASLRRKADADDEAGRELRAGRRRARAQELERKVLPLLRDVGDVGGGSGEDDPTLAAVDTLLGLTAAAVRVESDGVWGDWRDVQGQPHHDHVTTWRGRDAFRAVVEWLEGRRG